jgi:DNA-binding LytR/AlgR family response regulator
MNYDIQNTKSITISTKLITTQIIAAKISHIVCDDYLCNIFMENNKITCAKLLSYFELELDAYGFIRIRHNTIVNTKYIQQIEVKTKTIVLKNGIKLSVSPKRWKHFKAIFREL